jgi:hypothetical protein
VDFLKSWFAQLFQKVGFFTDVLTVYDNCIGVRGWAERH